MFDHTVVVRGGGDLGTGVAVRLWRCGFKVAVLETPSPVAVRRTVALSEAVFQARQQVEEVTGVLACSVAEALNLAGTGQIPVLVDAEATTMGEFAAFALVDAIMAKRPTGTIRGMAPVVVALGPGFRAGTDVDAVVETNRGPDLGRVIWQGEAEPNTGVPGAVGGIASDRVLRAPEPGVLRVVRDIGAIVSSGETVAEVNGQPIVAPFRALVRGLARNGLKVDTGAKVGDLDPRLDPALCHRISDKALAVAGGVLEAVLSKMKILSP